MDVLKLYEGNSLAAKNVPDLAGQQRKGQVIQSQVPSSPCEMYCDVIDQVYESGSENKKGNAGLAARLTCNG
jgi:hypothetical protein